MKKICILALLLSMSLPVSAAFNPPTTDPLEEPTVMRVTCYTANEGAICSTGVVPHYGVVAGSKEWAGKAVALYTFEYVDGVAIPIECIGLFTVLDTGAGIDTNGDGKGDSIKNGQSLDVYVDRGTQAEEWISRYGDYLLVQIIDGEG